MKKIFVFAFLTTTLMSQAQTNDKTVGTLERFDAALDKIVLPDAKAEIIAEGFVWSEGPLWIEKHGMLLFSDVPANTVYKWTEAKGKVVYLRPSGYTGTVTRGGETGSNGLLLDAGGRLVLCQHGNRQMARMDAPLEKPQSSFTTLANNFNGKRFNSPNDAVYNGKGELFFTDPPYGLEKGPNDPAREMSFQGVYRVKPNGEVALVTDTLTRPNGIAFFPDEKTLLVANSDPEKPNWYAFDVAPDGSVANGRIFFAAPRDGKLKGLPDGLKIDSGGTVFATGPGGVYIFHSKGKLLGRLSVPDPASNCALSPDEKTLYITNNKQVLRFRMRN